MSQPRLAVDASDVRVKATVFLWCEFIMDFSRTLPVAVVVHNQAT
jgi:hypothetical protein